jgi:hypothetical protein
LTGVKRLEKIMPEQIEPAAFNKVLAGEAHNFSNLCAVAGCIAMYCAVFANRLFLERTTKTSFKSIKQKFPALLTNRILVQGKALQPGFVSGHSSSISSMTVGTINSSKLQKQLEVFDFFTRQWLQTIFRESCHVLVRGSGFKKRRP